jgi:integral membrane sensor domain MASE1
VATVSGLLHPWRAPRDVAVEAPLASKLLVTALIVGVTYYAGAWIGFTTTFPGMGTARRHIFWPPNVILLAALVVTPVRWWWHARPGAHAGRLGAAGPDGRTVHG